VLFGEVFDGILGVELSGSIGSCCLELMLLLLVAAPPTSGSSSTSDKTSHRTSYDVL
jgi:hypothetical protein